jgi:C1A family cysteine protease
MSFNAKGYKQKFKKGLKRNHAKHAAFKAQAHKHLGAISLIVPGKTAFRTKMAPPCNQANCGCCWAFSQTNSLWSEFLLAGKTIPQLAFNFLINNCGGVVNEDGCNGGDFDAGQNFLNGKGPWLESQDPWDGCDNGHCKVGLPVAATAYRWVVVGDGQTKPTAQQLCEALWNDGNGHCLSVDVAADDTWSNYSSGIYNKNTSQEIDHMVRIVDYDAETSVDTNGNAVFDASGNFKNGDGFFYVRNNWDTTWGENGDMRSRYGANNLAETAMYFDIESTPTLSVSAPIQSQKSMRWYKPLLYILAAMAISGGVIGGLSYLVNMVIKIFF